MEIRELLQTARRGITHPNTDLDAQTFLLRYRQLTGQSLKVDYRPMVTPAELDDPAVLIWDIGKVFDPQRGNYDHHQDFELGATPIILLQSLGLEPSPLDRYVDQVDRGFFLRTPQPFPPAETLSGVASGINMLHRQDDVRSHWFQELLEWVEGTEQDPFGRFSEENLPLEFADFQEARRREARLAEEEAKQAEWFETRIGKIAFVQTPLTGTMHALYYQGAALVISYDPEGHFSGWRRPAPKYTVGANPALVDVPGRLDMRPLFDQLARLEPSGRTWGGQAGIGGSPREEGGSSLEPRQVIRTVLDFLETV